ncbi:hypothetical protein BDP27DRAFT_1236457 [Rhodocollybia butyracea]|uniref:E3 ubiquitin protein ligase n=1 Tax=Rhodocollybia butyracea TaxID=206335 RepID=A0A9P5PEJ0_9AGAR|nr:hypothetical protein BDP27DRAFT_1236457 [Rhodocollybia butyracea]
MSETRKRSHSVDDDKVILKKHIISDDNGSPKVNGLGTGQNDDVEPTGDDKLELFRKEAIYRRMLHYSRQSEASQKRISELEERKNTCEAGLAAMTACWMQLVDAIRVLVPESSEMSPSTEDLKDLFELSRYVSDDSMPELNSALDKSAHATQELVSKLVQKGSSQVSHDSALKLYQKTQSECGALRSQVGVLQVRLSESQELERTLRQQLADEQNRVQRLKSRTVQANLPKAGMGSIEASETTEDAPIKPSSPSVSGLPNGDVPNRMQEEWEERDARHVRQLREQDKTIEELRKVKAALEIEVKLVRFGRLSDVKEEVMKSPFYQRVLQRSANAINAASLKEDELKQIRSEFADYKVQRVKYEKELRDDSATAINDTLALIARRDADNARLREERDQRAADIHERRSKETVRIASCEEYKSLAASRADRILTLESQLQRAKVKLAANVNREDIVNFLLETPDKDIQFVDHLQARLADTEARLSALEEALLKLKRDHPDVAQHMQSEAEALQKLTQATSQLTKYQNVYGELSGSSSDQMARELQRKEEEIRRLRLLDSQHAQAESALYTEIEKLSSAWETLDGQVKNKVFDLSAMEERLTRATVDRAKSDNKYYAAVREKDTIEGERKSALRSLERQSKAFELLRQSEGLAREQTEVHEAQIKSHANKVLELQEKASEGSKMAEIVRMDAMSTSRLALEKERLNVQSKAKFDSTRHKNKSEDPNAELMVRLDIFEKRLVHSIVVPDVQSVLKCSTCNLNFRDTVLTKCSHTFCKPCVDARISSRQRKCPACGAAFAQSEVVKLFRQ